MFSNLFAMVECHEVEWKTWIIVPVSTHFWGPVCINLKDDLIFNLPCELKDNVFIQGEFCRGEAEDPQRLYHNFSPTAIH